MNAPLGYDLIHLFETLTFQFQQFKLILLWLVIKHFVLGAEFYVFVILPVESAADCLY